MVTMFFLNSTSYHKTHQKPLLGGAPCLPGYLDPQESYKHAHLHYAFVKTHKQNRMLDLEDLELALIFA